MTDLSSLLKKAAQTQSQTTPSPLEACYICGYETNQRNLLRCHTKKYEAYPDVPYYEILNNLDPAPKSLPINLLTNSVNACSLCVKMLYMQWLEYERKGTVSQKRLYWMKRPAGCEIKTPYSQVELDELFYDNEEVQVGIGAHNSQIGIGAQFGTGTGSAQQSLGTNLKRKSEISQPSEAKSLKIELSDDEEVQEIPSQTAAVPVMTPRVGSTAALTTTDPYPFIMKAINTHSKSSMYVHEVHCYLCGLKSPKNNFSKILIRQKSIEDDPNAIVFEKIISSNKNDGAWLLGDYSKNKILKR